MFAAINCKANYIDRIDRYNKCYSLNIGKDLRNAALHFRDCRTRPRPGLNPAGREAAM